MGVEKKVFSFRLEQQLVDCLKVLAKDQNRSLSNLVETVLLKYIEDNK